MIPHKCRQLIVKCYLSISRIVDFQVVPSPPHKIRIDIELEQSLLAHKQLQNLKKISNEWSVCSREPPLLLSVFASSNTP